ncbi:hypothetical protein EDF67_103226 [Sphingobacterium sp. JUb78]|nr:hypothetical protein EDF67_103226 [Sphingobacterium sp. JUb78]
MAQPLVILNDKTYRDYDSLFCQFIKNHYISSTINFKMINI